MSEDADLAARWEEELKERTERRRRDTENGLANLDSHLGYMTTLLEKILQAIRDK